MTEYWVSQAKHWCDVCKCWMSDTPTARANHEKGSGHKINVQRRLREMRLKAEQEEKEEVETKAQLVKIEAAADKAYQKDLARLDADAPPMPPPSEPPPQLGAWLSTEASQYLYNKELRFYYDPASQFYYGGDPPTWTQSPAIPEVALCKNLGKGSDKQVVRGKLTQNLTQLGGYQAPISGALTRGVLGSSTSNPTPKSTGSKRERQEDSKEIGKGESAREKEERKRRDEARARVEKRTAATFGLG